MQDVYKLFNKVGNSYTVGDDRAFFSFIDNSILQTDDVGARYFNSIRNQISFNRVDIEQMNNQLKRIEVSKDLEEKLASGNPQINEEGEIRFGVQVGLYKRVISLALYGQANHKKQELGMDYLKEFKSKVYTPSGIDPTFKDTLLGRMDMNIRKARNAGRVKGENTEENLTKKYEIVLDVLERYCRNSK